MHTNYLVIAALLGTGVSGTTTWQFIGPELSSLPPTCESNVFCQGVLLHDVQMAGLTFDSEKLPKMKLRYPEQEVVFKYNKLREEFGGKTPPVEEIKEFVNNNFENGDELEQWTPPDYKPVPSLVDKVSDPVFKTWVVDLNNIFLNLSHHVNLDVKMNPDLYSLLYVPNGFIIPGGTFTELYYWDSYWIVSGLLLCDMVTTARGVIENFFYLVRKYNFIPNGSRKYYLQRSQPPLLIPMVQLYYKHTQDLDFVRQNIEVMEKEFTFWMENRMVKLEKNGESFTLAHYHTRCSGPRPESYRNDYLLAEKLLTEEDKNELYIKIKSAAESGLDFSTRWFINNGTNDGNLSDIETPYIIPVDLNAFLQYNAVVMSNFYEALGNLPKVEEYKTHASKLLDSIEAFLWSGDRGIWLDFDLKNLKSRDYFYMSNFVPLWTHSYRQDEEEISKKVLKYLEESKVDQYIGGIPSSLYMSGEQWDFPNAWPPQEAILIEGLEQLGTAAAKSTARRYAEKWLRSNYKGYDLFRKMFEKYDVTLMGRTGSGGEYEAQTGFGWTIGVVLGLLDKYRDVGYYQDMEEGNWWSHLTLQSAVLYVLAPLVSLALLAAVIVFIVKKCHIHRD